MGKTKKNILQQILDLYPDEDFLLATGFDDAVIGFTSDFVVVYSIHKCLNILMTEHGMDAFDAVEFFHHNIEGAFVGEQSPIFINNNFK